VAEQRPVLSRIAALLAGYDDAALIALGNRGLLRRAKKDLEAATPELAGEDDDAVRVKTGGEEVRVPATVQGATCTCPSASICRHVLAALLFLREKGDGGHFAEGAAEEPGSAHGEMPPVPFFAGGASPVDEILAVDESALARWAGRALLQRAMREVAAGARPGVHDGAALVFEFTAWNQTVRWMPGGGLDGMVCTCHAAGPCVHRVAAVVAMLVERGRLTIEAEAVAPDASTGAARTRDEVLASLGELLADTVCLGLSRLSTTTEQRLRTLAVSAHGVDLPRLERLIRSLADEAALLLRRDAQATSATLLDRAARAEALRFALRRPTPELVGRHRSRYASVGAIDLVGVGARRWRAASGYVGLTVYFRDTSRGAWASWTDARPADVAAAFNPERRYHADGPWDGCESPAVASRSRLHLTGAYRNRSGRVSGRPSTRAFLMGGTAPDLLPEPIRDWSELADHAARIFGGGLAEPGELDGLVLLEPAEWAPPQFDPVAQELAWAVTDASGAAALLTLPHTPENESAIPLIERQRPTRSSRVLGTLLLRDGRLVAEPIALHHGFTVVNLTLDGRERRQGRRGRRRAASNASQAPAGAHSSNGADPPGRPVDSNDAPQKATSSTTPLGLLLRATAAELEAVAAGGVTAPYDLGRLQAAATQLERLGLSAGASATRAALNALQAIRASLDADRRAAGRAVLRAYYVLRLAAAQEGVRAAVDATTAPATG
jgi:hypothetical protein